MLKRKNKHYHFQRPKPRRFSRFVLAIGLLAGFTVIVLIFFNPLVWRLNLRSELEKSKIASTIYDRYGEAVVTLYSKSRLWVPIDQIPKHLQEAFIATEDYRFYEHKGIDFRGILRALVEDIRRLGKVQGGSTITQQLVKNIYFSQEKSVFRKIWEMAYAIRIEQQYSKGQILEFYLNSIYLGNGAWGVQTASEVYFGKTVRELDTSQCAIIAGLAKSPEYYSPFRRPQETIRRRNIVLNLMNKRGYLDDDQLSRYRNEPLNSLTEPGTTFVGAYFSDYVIEELKSKTDFSETYLRTSGLKIYTTMDRTIQAQTEKAIGILPQEGPDRWGIIQPQGAIVVIDPRTGEILGLVGGRKYSAAQPNRAFQIYRQPGSAIKPFVYTAALISGYDPEQKMLDQPTDFVVNGRNWRPQNYDNQYRGEITLRTALEESVNTIAVQLVQELGPDKVFQLARKMGLKSLVATGELNDQGLAPLALGGLTKGVTLLELTGTYSSFANQGLYSEPFGITRVYNQRGEVIYRAGIVQRQVIPADVADKMTSMMEGVISKGTGIRANIGVPAAGKTGTTNQNTNGWFIGYTSDLLTGVWIGNDRANQPLIAKGIAMGSGMASTIWGGLMRQVLVRTASLRANWLNR